MYIYIAKTLKAGSDIQIETNTKKNGLFEIT